MEKNCNCKIHRVVAGDTMYKIARMHGVRLVDLLKANPYVNVYNLQVGDEICVPIKEDIEEMRYYKTQKGDTIATVLDNTGVGLWTLFENNKPLFDMELKEDTIIRIPVK